jgi:hypothetical protein
MKKNFVMTILTVGLMITAIFYIRENPLFNFELFDSNYLNTLMNYLTPTLILSLLIVMVTALQTKFQSIKLLSITRIDGAVRPEPWIGISKKNKDSWKKVGLSFTIVISIVTAMVIYYQVFQTEMVQTFTLESFLLILLFALTNSFIEEVTFRHTFASIVEYHKLNPYISQALSALTFGIIHYFGVPSGIPGVLMAGFIGWFLSKSIHETKGFFWAWLIHFIQDVIIMTALFLTLN